MPHKLTEAESKADQENFKWGPGDTRKTLIASGAAIWLILWFILMFCVNSLYNSLWFVLPMFILWYFLDVLYTLTVTHRLENLVKCLLFQTLIPLTALTSVTVLTYFHRIEGSTVVTLFGLSLGYTTYVVGHEFGKERVYKNKNEEKTPSNSE